MYIYIYIHIIYVYTLSGAVPRGRLDHGAGEDHALAGRQRAALADFDTYTYIHINTYAYIYIYIYTCATALPRLHFSVNSRRFQEIFRDLCENIPIFL